MANLKRVLWHLLAGTRGGPLRIRILAMLREVPSNTNQVATQLGIDYKTAQHHLRVLTENRVVSPTGQGYGAVYLLTPDMEQSLEEFDRIAAKLAARARPAPPPPATAPAEGPGAGRLRSDSLPAAPRPPGTPPDDPDPADPKGGKSPDD